MPTAILASDYERASQLVLGSAENIRNAVAKAIADERERCATVALEQRCERGNGWDLACVAIARKIRNEE